MPLTGEWEQVQGFNANGIAETPDHRALLVVQSATGLLFRVDPATGAATVVDLGGYALTNGDGLLVVGRTLYVVQNQLNLVAEIRLDAHGTSGVLVDHADEPRVRRADDRGRLREQPVPAERAVLDAARRPTPTYEANRIDR